MSIHTLIDGMDEEDSKELVSILKQAIKCKNLISKPKLRYKMVPASQWVNDEYYVGVEGSYIYPYWKNLLVDIFETNRGKYNEVILSGGLGCLDENTLIPTTRGLISLKEIDNINSESLSRNINLLLDNVYVRTDQGPSEISLSKYKGKAKTKRIIFESGRVIEGTYDHQFKVLDKSGKIIWKKLKEVTKDDYFVGYRDEQPFGTLHFSDERIITLTKNCLETEMLAKDIFLLNRECMKIFLSNIFYNSYSIKSRYKDKKFLRNIQSILDLFGINSKINFSNSTLSIEEYDELLFDKLILDQGIEDHYELPKISLDESTITTFILSKCYLDKVKKIVNSKTICRDLSIVKHHNYSVNAFMSHNTGKTSCANFLMIRKLYELSCYDNIAGLFDLMPSSIIGFMYFNVSKAQAELTGYGQFKGMIDQIPYFRDKFQRNERLDSILQFPDNVMFMYGSSSVHCLAPNSMILTNRGIVRAKDLKKTHLVYDGSNYKKINYVYKAEGTMYSVTTDTGRELITKDNHLHYTNRGFIETKDLEIGDLLFSAIKGYKNNSLKKYKSICGTKFKSSQILTLLAVILAKGEFKKDGSIDIQVYPRKFLEYISDYSSDFEITGGSIANCNFIIKSKEIIDLVEKFKINHNIKYRTIPDEIVSLCKEDVNKFLAGFIYSTGNIANNQITMNFLSYSLSQDVMNLFSCMGYLMSTFKRSYGDTRQTYVVSFKGNASRDFIENIEIPYEILSKFMCKSITQRKVKNGLNYESITRVTKLGVMECYGASVEGEIYTCNSLLTHNSIGMNIIGTILDEANFFQKDAQSTQKSTANYSKVADMYSSVVNRSASRFMSKGHDSSLSILVSSNTSTSSFTDKRIRESLLLGEKSKTKVVNARLWEVKPKGTYSDKVFYVFKGTNLIDPFIVTNVNDIKQYLESMNKPLKSQSEDIDEVIKSLDDYDKDYFIPIPEDFKKSFEVNITRSLQDIAGISVAPMGKLFNSRTTYLDSCVDYIEHPFYKDEISVATGDNIQVWDFVKKNYRPTNLDKPRFVHIDMSTTNDSTGIGMCYIDHWEKTPSGINLPCINIDMKLRINPPNAPRKISIQKIIDFIFWMRKAWGIHYGWVSQDQFQSSYSLQAFEEAGIPSGLESVDRTAEAYLYYIQCMYEGRVKGYRYTPEERELFDLLFFPNAGPGGAGKVDHPTDGCLVGDTLIKTTKGAYRIEDLVGKKATLYTFDKNGNFIVSPMKKCWKTKEVTSLMEITFSNGAMLSCTTNHPIMLYDKSFIEADKLNFDNRIFTFSTDFIYPISIEEKHYTKPVPVYDIEMSETDNFMLYNSIVVHNSKDVCDGIVGAVFNAFKHGSELSPGLKSDAIEGMLDYYKDRNKDSDEIFTMDELLGMSFDNIEIKRED